MTAGWRSSSRYPRSRVSALRVAGFRLWHRAQDDSLLCPGGPAHPLTDRKLPTIVSVGQMSKAGESCVDTPAAKGVAEKYSEMYVSRCGYTRNFAKILVGFSSRMMAG